MNLTFPPGIYKNGTELQSAGRWIDSNHVRFHDGTIQPIGGWRGKYDTDANAKIRGSLAWSSLDGTRRVIVGTYNKLYVYNASGTQTDITPIGLVAGDEDATFPDGFGNYDFGQSEFGLPMPVDDTPIPATTWDLSTWGEYVIACSSADGKIYEYNLTSASQVSNAPIDNSGVMVTDERFVFCLGAGGNPKKVQWSDREDNTTWTPLATNEAGDIELQTDGEIMLGIKVKGQSLIITSTDAHSATYQGAPFVYGFERVGSACGAISKKCATSANGVGYWMGDGSFFSYAGTVQEVPCDVSDYVFTEMNQAQKSKIFAVPNKKFSEVWWFYPSSDSVENDRYVVYNYQQNIWYVGQLSRTSGVDSDVLPFPVYFTQSSFEHEVGQEHDTSPYIESAPFTLGDDVMMIKSMRPDEKTQGDVEMSLTGKFYQNDTEYSFGTYQMANPVDIRATARFFKVKITGRNNSDFRIGVNTLDVAQGGRR